MLKTYVKTQLAIQNLREDIKGASLIEYSLLIGLISIAVVVVIGTVAGDISSIWDKTKSATGKAAA